MSRLGVMQKDVDLTFDWRGGVLRGQDAHNSRKTFGELRDLFAEGAGSSLAEETELYRVSWTGTRGAGATGALLFGCTTLAPGVVGEEFFMTHGHFHADRTRDEIYLPVSGRGLLLRMDEERRCWAEDMIPGKVVMISGVHAHRVVNTGDEPLVFWASWPADAGYDYGTIRSEGFSIRVFRREGGPVMVPTVEQV